MPISFKTIAAFLDTRNSAVSRLLSYTGLGLGVFLLLTAVQLYLDINQLIRDKNPRKNGYDFISITKKITDENMGRDNRFTEKDLADLKKQNFIQDAAPLRSNQFRVKASAGKIIPFTTDLFLESLNPAFIDTVPPGFGWRPGQTRVPIIFSADFLEMYNVFAPAQDLPQLSANTIGAVNIILECYGPSGVQNFTGNIVAVSDRINSVLVPESFLNWANRNFGNIDQSAPARIYLKTLDANDPAFLKYIEENGFHINKDKTKFGRVKQVLKMVVTGLGIFAIMVIALAMMLFSFYLQLVIARSKENLRLLVILGYSPAWLTKTVSRKWISAYAFIIFLATCLTALVQFLVSKLTLTGEQTLPAYPSVYVLALALVLFLVSILAHHRLVKKLLHEL